MSSIHGSEAPIRLPDAVGKALAVSASALLLAGAPQPAGAQPLRAESATATAAHAEKKLNTQATGLITGLARSILHNQVLIRGAGDETLVGLDDEGRQDATLTVTVSLPDNPGGQDSQYNFTIEAPVAATGRMELNETEQLTLAEGVVNTTTSQLIPQAQLSFNDMQGAWTFKGDYTQSNTDNTLGADIVPTTPDEARLNSEKLNATIKQASKMVLNAERQRSPTELKPPFVQPEGTESSPPPPQPYTLVPGMAPVAAYTNTVYAWIFNGSKLPLGWAPANGTNDGMEATTFEASQVTVAGGTANLTAVPTTPGTSTYRSGFIESEATFGDGRFDIIAKMPAGQGLWPALWLDGLGTTAPFGEIDVAEMPSTTHIVYGSLHDWGASNGLSQIWGKTQSTYMTADASQGFHDYSVTWQPGESGTPGMITWAVDGVAYAQYSETEAPAGEWPFGDSSTNTIPGAYLRLIADLAVASPSEWGGGPEFRNHFSSFLAD